MHPAALSGLVAFTLVALAKSPLAAARLEDMGPSGGEAQIEHLSSFCTVFLSSTESRGRVKFSTALPMLRDLSNCETRREWARQREAPIAEAVGRDRPR